MAHKDASPDTQIDLKKSARRRLVGAIALALLAVVALPMVMDHEPRPPSQDIQIHIPSPETTAGPAPHVAAGKSVAPSAAVAFPKTEIAIDKPEDKAQGDSKGESGQMDTQKAAVPAMKQNDKPATDKATHVPTIEEAHAVATLNGGGDQWLVRLGAYQNAANVKQLLAKVKEAGIQAYAEKFDSPKGARTRVLAGPFSSREAAEKAQGRIKKLGVDGAVIAKQ